MRCDDGAVRVLPRRDFVAKALGAILPAALVLPAACASLSAIRVRPENGTLRIALADHPILGEKNGFVKVLPEGAADPLYIFALGSNVFAAVSSVCTHLGCTVDAQRDRLVCPCHGSTYSADGSVLRGPAERPLLRFRTLVTADRVLVVNLQEEV